MKMFLRRLNRIFVAFVLLIGYAFAADTAPVTAKVTLSKDKITIGDKVKFKLLAEGKGDVKIAPVDLSPYLSTFEIKEHAQKGPYKSWGKTRLEYDLVLTTFTTGNYEIPEIKVKYTDKDGIEKEAVTTKLILVVEAVKAGPNDKDDIRDVKPPLTLPHSFWFWFFTVILPLLAVAGFFLYRYLRSKKLNNIMEKAEPARPPHEVAYERLSKLIALKLVEEGRVKEHYYLLSEIIRSFLEARYEIPIVERTTSEAYFEMTSSGKLKRKEVTLIKDFLEECDLVKFAKMLPEVAKTESDYETGVAIVDQNKFIPPPQVQEPESAAKGGQTA